jgi:hypothetical protein
MKTNGLKRKARKPKAGKMNSYAFGPAFGKIKSARIKDGKTNFAFGDFARNVAGIDKGTGTKTNWAAHEGID